MNIKKISKLIPILFSLNILNPITGYASELSLEEAIASAVQNNYGLQATQESENTAKASLEKAKGESGFTVSLSNRIDFSKKEGNDITSNNSVSVNGNYSIYDGGKNKNNIKNRELEVDIAELQIEKATSNLVINVTKAYYDALEARDTIKVNQDTVKNYVAHLDNVQKLFTGGAKAKIDVLRTEVELANAKQNLTKSQVNYDTKMAILMNYMQDNRKEIPVLTSKVTATPIPKKLSEYLTYASENNATLKIDRHKIRQAENNLDSANAGYKPTVNFSTSVGKNYNVYNSKEDDINFTSGVSINWNIFDNGVTKANVDEKTSLLKIAKLNMMNDKQNIDLDVKSAYLNLVEAKSRFESTGKAIQKAEEDYRISLIKYTAGEGILLDIIDAQIALSTARLNYYNAQYDYARHKAELENAIGSTFNISLNKKLKGDSI